MRIIDVLVHGKDRSDSTELVYLNQQLENRGIKVDVQRIGERTVIALLTEKDGWETVGKLGSGRFFDRGQNQCDQATIRPNVDLFAKAEAEAEVRRYGGLR